MLAKRIRRGRLSSRLAVTFSSGRCSCQECRDWRAGAPLTDELIEALSLSGYPRSELEMMRRLGGRYVARLGAVVSAPLDHLD
jgi:hypothetical protein